MNKLSVYGDIKKNICVVHFIFRLSHERQWRLEVKQTVLEIYAANKLHYTLDLGDVAIIPETCNGLLWNGLDGLHMRFKIKYVPEYYKGSPVNGCMSDLKQLLENATTSVQCGRCGVNLTKYGFDRVIEAPSDGWNEFEESLFCHDHNKQEHNPHFSDRDCWMSNVHLVFNKAAFLNGCIILGEYRTVKCARCRKVVGKTQKYPKAGFTDPVTLYLSEVVVRAEKSNILNDICQTSHGTIESLCNYILTESDINHSYRIIIEVTGLSEEIQPFILLWILDRAGQQMICPTENEQDIPKSSKCKVHSVATFLFKQCTHGTNRELAMSWRKEMSTHIIVLSVRSSRFLLKHLINSNGKMPESLRKHDTFLIGVLPRKT